MNINIGLIYKVKVHVTQNGPIKNNIKLDYKYQWNNMFTILAKVGLI